MMFKATLASLEFYFKLESLETRIPNELAKRSDLVGTILLWLLAIKCAMQLLNGRLATSMTYVTAECFWHALQTMFGYCWMRVECVAVLCSILMIVILLFHLQDRYCYMLWTIAQLRCPNECASALACWRASWGTPWLRFTLRMIESAVDARNQASLNVLLMQTVLMMFETHWSTSGYHCIAQDVQRTHSLSSACVDSSRR